MTSNDFILDFTLCDTPYKMFSNFPKMCRHLNKSELNNILTMQTEKN